MITVTDHMYAQRRNSQSDVLQSRPTFAIFCSFFPKHLVVFKFFSGITLQEQI